MELILCLSIVLLCLAFVYWQLWRTNMEIPPEAEKRVSRRAALYFAIDNHLLP